MNLKNPSGLSITFLENGSLKSIDIDPIRIGVRVPTSFSKPETNLYLRKRSNPYKFIPLLGPESNSSFKISDNAFIAKGSWEELEYTCVLELSKKSNSWQWRIDIINTNGSQTELDLFYVQDAGLKPISAGLNNEYYVSQYLERRIMIDEKYGSVICCRQNMKESIGNPWLIMACKNRAIAGSVDGMQFYGKTFRDTGVPEGLLVDRLGGEYAGESSVLVLQENPFRLGPGENHQSIFLAGYLQDHPQATSAKDLERLSKLALEFDEQAGTTDPANFISPEKNIFNTSAFLPVYDLTDDELTRFFDKNRRHPEVENGKLLSFFYDKNTHVILRSKEILVDRPHAHIMEAQAGYVADENIVSTSCFAFGIFNSHLTQGNTNFNTLLSVCTSQFNLATETGQRIFMETDGQKYLLGVPSAFEIGLNHCRWIYKHGESCFQVRSWTSKNEARVNMDFKVISGKNVKLLVTHHFDALNSWSITQGSSESEFIARPETGSMIAGKFPGAQFKIIINTGPSGFQAGSDEVLYPSGKQPGKSLFVLEVKETKAFSMSFIGEVCSVSKPGLIADADKQFISDCRDGQAAWQDMSLHLSLGGAQGDTAAIQEILPWYGMNALTHYLTPYGLEQFSGAAWGTRDISQGPFDVLLSMEKYDAARQLLLTIFANQDTDGGWPQWWMFDSYTNIRADHSHGDVFYWCIIALANYIKVTGDLKILDEVLPYHPENSSSKAVRTPISEHIDRLIKMIVASFVPGTSLVPYGNGDWNDSLQPVSKELAERMISSWTVEMNYQAFNQYRKIYERCGNKEKANALREICDRIREDFNKYLIKDGVVAGYGLVEADGSVSLLLHPTDTKTNIQYSILPMNRGIISGIFTMEQAQHHQELIELYLKGPDGARLMNRPLKYRGGIQAIFQRAESSTFFGREIGLMYVHEHIRYAESQAITGKPEAFLKALRQAIPVGYRDVVPCGDFRQSNCYYSSSDVSFRNRYEADELYDQVKTGRILLKGGWRVYSSGPGIFIGLVVSRLLGLRTESGNTILDPVMPKSLDGFSATMDYLGHSLKLSYTIKDEGFSPKKLVINGKETEFHYEENRYRQGGAVISNPKLLALLDKPVNTIKVFL